MSPENVVNPLILTCCSNVTLAVYLVSVAIATANPDAALRTRSPDPGAVLISVLWVPTPAIMLLSLAPFGKVPVISISPPRSTVPLVIKSSVKLTSLENVTGPSNWDRIFCWGPPSIMTLCLTITSSNTTELLDAVSPVTVGIGIPKEDSWPLAEEIRLLPI